MTGVHSRARSFDAAAAVYERGRSGWPEAAIDIVQERLGLDAGAAVLDLAAGTGKLTRRLVARFAEVIAVEPLDGMRAVLAAQAPGARVLAGTAEAIPLEDASVDAVLVGDAIHWFDPERAVAEIARVLRPGRGVAVLYHRLQPPDTDWRRDLAAVFEARRLPPDDVDPFDETRWRASLAAVGPLADDAVEHVDRLDAEGVEAMYASYSGLAGLPPERRDAAVAEIRAVLERHAVTQAELPYRIQVTTARGA